MKKYAPLLTILFYTVFSMAQRSEPDFLIENVSIVPMTGDEVLHNQNVLVKDAIIIRIEPTTKKRIKVKKVIDGKGKYIMPSLADAHVHFPETEAKMERVMTLYLINGVTKLRSMRGDWKHKDWRDKYNKENSIYLKLYLSPPPISRQHDFTASQIEDYVKASKESGFDFIKILSIKDQATFSQFNALCKAYNIPIAGHFLGNVSDRLIFNSNYTAFEHLGGLSGNPNNLDDRLQLLKEKNMFICPTLSWYSIGSGRYTFDQLRNLSGMEFIPKAILDEWIEKTKQYRDKLGNQAYAEEVANELKSLDEKYKVIKQIHAMKIPMLLSPDSSSKYMVSGFDMVGEMELLKNAELSNYEILRMATTNFATFYGENYGTIEAGKDADFIVLSTNPLEDLDALRKIEGVYFNNQFLDKEKLATMRKELLETSQN